MIDRIIQGLLDRQDHGQKLEERDLKLVKLMKKIDDLPEDQKKTVLPLIEATLARHEEIGKQRQSFGRFFNYLDEAVQSQKKTLQNPDRQPSGPVH